MSDDLNSDMDNNTDPFSENDAAYVMGALTDADRRAFEAHVSGCGECAAEVRTFQRVSAALSLGVTQRTPPGK